MESTDDRNALIRQRRRDNATYRELAEAYGLSVSRIAEVCIDVTPKRLDPELRRKTNEEIRSLRAQGLSFQTIADHLGVSLDRAFKVARYVETPTQRVQREMSSVPT